MILFLATCDIHVDPQITILTQGARIFQFHVIVISYQRSLMSKPGHDFFENNHMMSDISETQGFRMIQNNNTFDTIKLKVKI